MICYQWHQSDHFKHDCPTNKPVESLSADEADEKEHEHAGEEDANNTPPLPESSDSASDGDSDSETIARRGRIANCEHLIDQKHRHCHHARKEVLHTPLGCFVLDSLSLSSKGGGCDEMSLNILAN